MALFEFELMQIEDVVPWGPADDPSLSWFALTYGGFRMPVGDAVLFEYTQGILEHWSVASLGLTYRDDAFTRAADYQLASFARTMLESAAAGAAPLPRRVEELAEDWDQLLALRLALQPSDDDPDEVFELWAEAWRWLGERSPWTSYLVASPQIHFVRVGDSVRIHWDNRDLVVDGHAVWTANAGVHTMPVDSFVRECRLFAERLLAEMDSRVAMIEAGAARPQTQVDVESLRVQRETWRAEFESYLEPHRPEVSWDQTERALQALANAKKVKF